MLNRLQRLLTGIALVTGAVLAFSLVHGQKFSEPNDRGFRSVAYQGFVFEWKVAGDGLDCVIRASTKGWVAVGFNASKTMNGANLIMGYVGNNGDVVIQDQHGKGHTHRLDGVQNVGNAFGSEQHGVTELRFTIPLNSGDGDDLVLTPGQNYYLLMAMGDKDNLLVIHKKKTGVAITL